jgi:hypothetical protein
MNNLEKIKAALKMGWSATIFHKAQWDNVSTDFQVVGINEYSACLYSKSHNKYCELGFKSINNTEKLQITGYKYAGELAGNEPIPEGQKFRVKETGEIIKYTKDGWLGVPKFGNTFPPINRGYSKSEIEPYWS